MNNKIPDLSEWENYQADFDVKSAFDNFYGLSFEKAKGLCRSDPLSCFTDLRFMPIKPFQFYFLAYKDIFLSGQLDDMSVASAAQCLLTLIEIKLDESPDYVLSIWNEIIPALQFIALNQETYQSTEHIYGNFQERVEKIMEKKDVLC